MHRYSHQIGLALTMLALGLTLLSPSGARAENTYTIQPIIALGDTVADGQIKVDLKGDFETGSLNDSGQIIFLTENAAGGEMLVQYAEGKFTLIAARGMESPLGKWPHDVGIHSPVSMNQRGNVVFAPVTTDGGLRPLGTCLWDRQTQKVTAVALKGMPAGNDLTFTDVGSKAPAINNRDEIVFPAQVKTAAGRSGLGLFFLGQDGTLLPVLLSDPELHGGGKIHSDGWSLPSINDAGRVAFLAQQQGTKQDSAYVWEQGTIAPVLLVGSDAPGGRVTSVSSVHLNNKNRNALVTARLSGSSSYGLYLVANGQVIPVVVPGQEMPGGGKFNTIQGLPFTPDGNTITEWVSAANEAGQHAFVTTLEGGATAAYLMEADGQLSLILKSGTSTSLGQITRVGSASNTGRGAADSIGLGLNSKGQVALTVRTADNRVTLILLTPTVPQQ